MKEKKKEGRDSKKNGAQQYQAKEKERGKKKNKKKHSLKSFTLFLVFHFFSILGVSFS